MGISNSDLLDLQRTTLENLPDMDFETALEQQDFLALNYWFKKDKIQVDSGTSISRRIMLDNSGNARHVRLYQKSSVNVGQVLTTVSAPWVQIEGQYSIERREALRNRKPAQYIELLKTRRLDAMLAMASLLEERAWKTPQNSTDDLNPRGLPYWLSKAANASMSAVTSTPGFFGKRIVWNDGSGTLDTDKGGISPAAQENWRNWTDVIDGMNGLTVKKLAKAFYATKFQSPMTASDLLKGPKANYRIYMGLDDLVNYDDLARKANDNLGADLAKFHGQTAFNRVPVLWSPNLDSDTSTTYGANPIYGVNHAKFFPIVQEGDWMREGEPMTDAEQHNVFTTFVDGSYQYFCTNVREAGFVLHRVASS